MTRTKFTRTRKKLMERVLFAPKGRIKARMKELQAFMRKALEAGI